MLHIFLLLIASALAGGTQYILTLQTGMVRGVRGGLAESQKDSE